MHIDDDAYLQIKEALRPTLEDLERRRLRVLAFRIVFWACCTVPLILIFSHQYPLSYLANNSYILAIYIPLALIESRGTQFVGQGYHKDFKNQIVRKLIAQIDESFQYEPQKHISFKDYIASGIFKIKCDSYTGDDYVSGSIEKTRLAFSELHTSYTTSGKHRYTKNIFHGLFAVVDFHKDFQGKTYVLPIQNMAKSTWDVLWQLQQYADQLIWTAINQPPYGNYSHGEPIKLEDPEFERRFSVYGTDQIEVRYLLSTSLMERMVQFSQKTKAKTAFAFSNSKLYVAIHHNRKLFEPPVYKSLLKYDALDTYLEDLQLILGMVKDLNLNLNIWKPAQYKA